MKNTSTVFNLYFPFLLLFITLGIVFFELFPIFAQNLSPLKEGQQYYLKLKNEDFMQAMVPKEEFLLGIVQNVTDEIHARESEGDDLSDLGIEKVVSPEEKITDEYVQEFQRIGQLIDEISRLEQKAKEKVDLNVLRALSNLKERVRKIIEGTGSQNVPKSSVKNSQSVVNTKTNVGVQKEENKSSASADSAGDGRFVDIFEQWKYNRILDYKLKLTEYEFLRTRLLKTATPSQEKRMLQRDLKRALESYSNGDFLLSRLQLHDILNTYTRYRLFDDVLYYYSESCYGLNYLDEAMKGYRSLIVLYPESPFSARALVKIIYIKYIYGQFDEISSLYQQLLLRKKNLDPQYFGTVSYLVGYAYFKAGNYNNALISLGNVPQGTAYFFPSLYLSAACYSNMGQDDSAISIYQRLINEKNKGGKDPVLAQLKNNALLKLGLIYYERGENQKATLFFNNVSNNSKYYDLSVLGKAWSAYRAGKPGEALENVEWVLHNSMVSNYTYEAKVLAAGSKELLGHPEEAIKDLKDVYRVGTQAEQLGKYPSNRASLLQDLQHVEEAQRMTFADNDKEKFAEIRKISQFLQGEATKESQTKKVLREKIKTLDKLEKQAKEDKNKTLLNNIRQLRSNLIQTLQDQTGRFSEVSQNLEEDPLVRRMGMTEYLRYIFRSLLLETVREKEQTKKDINEAERLLRDTKKQDKFDLQIRMEIKKEELEDYYGKLNQYEVWLRENFPQDFRVELSRWATFSGYGISNINFSRIGQCDQQIARISQTIDTLDRVFKMKKKGLNNRIQGLLKDVATIEEQMRREVEKRQQKEKEQFFNTKYFEKEKREPPAGKLDEKPVVKEKAKK